MTKPDKTVIKEGCFIALAVLAMSIVMELVFLLIKRWNYTVLLGNLLGGSIAVLNFFLIGITIQNAVGKEQDEIKRKVRFSYSMRMFLISLGIIIGVAFPCFNSVASVLPYLFPRIAISLRPLFIKD